MKCEELQDKSGCYVAGTSCQPIRHAKVVCSGATIHQLDDFMGLIAEEEEEEEEEYGQ